MELDEEGTGCMSDRAKGISTALKKVLPVVIPLHCIKHLGANLKQQGKGSVADVKTLTGLANVRDRDKFATKEQEMKAAMKPATAK